MSMNVEVNADGIHRTTKRWANMAGVEIVRYSAGPQSEIIAHGPEKTGWKYPVGFYPDRTVELVGQLNTLVAQEET